jgi:hypothetical protein
LKRFAIRTARAANIGARELVAALEYTNWRNFKDAVQAAMKACDVSGN